MITGTRPKSPAGESAGQLLSRRALAERWGCIDTVKNKERAGAIKPIRNGSKLLRYDLNDIPAHEALAGGMGQ